MKKSLPIVAVTMGDPAGIGPEICASALVHLRALNVARPIIIGDAGVIDRAREFVNVDAKVNAISTVKDARFEPNIINILDLKNVDLSQLQLGKVSAMAGNAAFEAVCKAIELGKSKLIDATVTAPIHKEALSLAGHKFPGHTEIFAHFTGTSDFTMMLAAGKLRVCHVSTHISLRQACDAVTKQRVRTVIQLGHDACVKLGIAKPHIGVAGLNPHASDGGLFGSEERNEIIPAIDDAKRAGLNVEGPFAPDTFFVKAVAGAYDVVIAMYHDQGHIAAKICGFKFDAKANAWTSVEGINVSLGLPIIRVSVDHGTAFDQAGKGTASNNSLLEAIEYAAKLASA